MGMELRSSPTLRKKEGSLGKDFIDIIPYFDNLKVWDKSFRPPLVPKKLGVTRMTKVQFDKVK